MLLPRRDLLRAALAVPLLAACKGSKPTGPTGPTGPVALQDIAPAAAPDLRIVEATSELLPGTARYAFGLVGPDGPLAAAKATVHLGSDPEKPATTTVAATELSDSGLAGRGLYVATLPFPAAGSYFVAIVADTTSGSFKGGTRLVVAATSTSPVPGGRVPIVTTPTTAQPRGAKPLCSQRPKPCSMHDISLDAALGNGKPTVVVFAAPAFCQTELCGPDVTILDGIAARLRGRANFIHVEAYIGATTPTDGTLAPALKAFGFSTEPWLYLIDTKSVVADRIQGAFSGAEVTDRLARLGVT